MKMKSLFPIGLTIVLVLALAFSGCGGGSGSGNSGGGQSSPPLDKTVIDLSHDGINGNGFGDGPGTDLEAKRWQTFIAPAGYPIASSIEIKIHRFGRGNTYSPIRAELYATDAGGKPTGVLLAYSLISINRLSEDYSNAVVETGLYYDGLIPGTQYAVVLTQVSLNNDHYEWIVAGAGASPAGLHYGKYTVDDGWVDETSDFGHGWLKVHLARTAPVAIYMFVVGLHDGNLKSTYASARAGADASGWLNLPASLTGKTVRAFISINAVDCIAMMPQNFDFPTVVPIYNAEGSIKIADNWADLMDGSIDTQLRNAIPMPDYNYWWSGSNADGTLSTNGNCGGWDENDGSSAGTCGCKLFSDSGWISAGFAHSDTKYYILGIAY